MKFLTTELIIGAIIGAIFGGMVSIPIGLYVNAYTPHFQNWLASRSYKKAQKRIKGIDKQYNEILKIRESKDSLVFIGLSLIVPVLIWFILFCFFFGTFLVIQIPRFSLEFFTDNLLIIDLVQILLLYLAFVSLLVGFLWSLSGWTKLSMSNDLFDEYSEKAKKSKEKLAQVKPKDQKEIEL
ncbi:MAG TPA: hypothetical protein VF692_02965 [Pyrinomonadaceae bacterium]|jgi:hypothetical protein